LRKKISGADGRRRALAVNRLAANVYTVNVKLPGQFEVSMHEEEFSMAGALVIYNMEQ